MFVLENRFIVFPSETGSVSQWVDVLTPQVIPGTNMVEGEEGLPQVIF